MRPVCRIIQKTLWSFFFASLCLLVPGIAGNAIISTGNAEPGAAQENDLFAAKPKEHLFPSPDIQPVPAKGRFLVAGKKMQDPRFRESVVLLIEYSPRGAMGLIINRPTKVLLTDLIKDLPELKARKDTAFYGGPVETNRIFLIIRSTNNVQESFKVMEGLYMSMSKAIFGLIVSGKINAPFKSYAGYSGWAAGQLDAEISHGDWYVTNGDARMIFEQDPKTLWQKLMRTASAMQV